MSALPQNPFCDVICSERKKLGCDGVPSPPFMYSTKNVLICKTHINPPVYRLRHDYFGIDTVKPLITNTSEEFIKCRLDNFSMSFILYYINFSVCENK